jgi:ABC-2 type transport system permease protein
MTAQIAADLTLAPQEQPRGAAPLRLVKAELLKIWTTNTWWIFGILTLAFTAIALLINLFQAHSDIGNVAHLKAQGPPNFDVPPGQQGDINPDEIARIKAQYAASIDMSRVLIKNAANIYTSGQFFGLLFVVILGALIVTNEFFHQTATTTFLTTPRRTEVILSKFGAAALFGAGFWLMITVIDLAVGSLFFSSEGQNNPLTEWPVVRSVLLNLLGFAIWAILGIGLGVLIRSQLGATLTAAVSYLFSVPFASIVLFLIHQYIFKSDWIWDVGVLVPGVASAVMISPEPVLLGNASTGPAWWLGLIVLIGYGLLAGAIGTLITRRRDIS